MFFVFLAVYMTGLGDHHFPLMWRVDEVSSMLLIYGGKQCRRFVFCFSKVTISKLLDEWWRD